MGSAVSDNFSTTSCPIPVATLSTQLTATIFQQCPESDEANRKPKKCSGASWPFLGVEGDAQLL